MEELCATFNSICCLLFPMYFDLSDLASQTAQQISLAIVGLKIMLSIETDSFYQEYFWLWLMFHLMFSGNKCQPRRPWVVI